MIVTEENVPVAEKTSPRGEVKGKRMWMVPTPQDGRPAGSAKRASTQAPVFTPLPPGPLKGSQDDFYDSRSDKAVRRLIEAVVKQEGPVSLEQLARRVISRWGMARLGSSILERIRNLAEEAELKPATRGERVFYWPAGVSPESYSEYRIPGADENSRRDIADIAPEEIANAALRVLEMQIGLPMADLVRETARLLGFARAGSNVDACVREGVALLVASGRAMEQGGVIVDKG